MIDKDEAIRLLRKEVANKGADYVYKKPAFQSSCVYFDCDQPSCLVGHAFADVGITRDDLGSRRNELGITAEAFSDIVEQDASYVFSVAQNHQDRGRTWGAALESAESAYRSMGGTE